MWDYTIERGYAAVNPARAVKLFKVEKLPPKYLTWEQIETILSAMTLESKVKYECLLNLGVRPKELSKLCLSDVDLERGHITIHHTKTRTFRVIPINGRLRPYLERLKKEMPVLDRWKPREHHNLLFYNWAIKGREAQIMSFKSSLQRILNKLEWEKRGISPYIFRHSFASHIASRGINVRVVQELLGHSSIVMTQRYTHAFTEDLRSGVEVLASGDVSKMHRPSQ
jgi:integrase/recombinase XerC